MQELGSAIAAMARLIKRQRRKLHASTSMQRPPLIGPQRPAGAEGERQFFLTGRLQEN
jgi:hypothetical protein